GEGVVRGERLRADKAGLFAVGEQQYDVVAGPRPRGEGAGDLQDRGDRGLVVGGTGRGGGGVVVRGDQDRPGRVGSGDLGDDVRGQPRRDAAAEGARPDPGLHLGVEAECAQLAGDVRADVGGSLAADGGGAGAGDALQVRPGPLGAELRGG